MAQASNVPNVIVSPEKFQLVVGVNEDCTIELTNVGYETVLYRMLTTARDRYYVKHTKGVIRGNTSTPITISINRKHMLDDAPAGAKVLKDDFRLECVFMGEHDVIEPHAQNVPQIIKDRKAADASSVLRKMLRCHLLLEHDAEAAQRTAANVEAATTTTTTPAPTAAGTTAMTATAANATSAAAQQQQQAMTTTTTAAAGARKMTPLEMEHNTLLEQQRRKGGVAGGGGGGSSLVPSKKVLITVGVVVVLFVAWLFNF